MPERFTGLIAHNLVVSFGTLSAGLLGVAFQILIAHRLTPADYGGVFAVITLLTVFGLPTGALTLTMARETSADRATGSRLPSAALLQAGNKRLLILGTVICLVACIFAPLAGGLLKISPELLAAAAVGLPFALALPLLIGEVQGQQSFASFAWLTLGQATLKLVAALVFGLFLGTVGVILGISVASATTYVLARFYLRPEFAIRVHHRWPRSSLFYLGRTLAGTLAVSLLLSADVLLVKHFFSPSLAGEYGAVAALGRAIFWVATGISAVLFPLMVFTEGQGLNSRPLILRSLLLLMLGAILGLIVVALGARSLLVAFAGPAYINGARYLPWYAVAMTLLGASNVLITAHQSRGRLGFLGLLLPVTLLEPAFIVLHHATLQQVVEVVVFWNAVLLAALTLLLASESPLKARLSRFVWFSTAREVARSHPLSSDELPERA